MVSSDFQQEEPDTEQLLEELLSLSDPDAYLAENKGVSQPTLSLYLNEMLERHGLVRSEVIRRAGLNSTFGYQIFIGQRKASRNKLLQLAFAMGLNLKETNRLLRCGGLNALCCKDRRDAVIIVCLDKGRTFQQVENQLYQMGEDTIC